jgi:hypothetical protein
MTERDFMLILRRALLMIVRAIEQRYELSKRIFEPEETPED